MTKFSKQYRSQFWKNDKIRSVFILLICFMWSFSSHSQTVLLNSPDGSALTLSGGGDISSDCSGSSGAHFNMGVFGTPRIAETADFSGINSITVDYTMWLGDDCPGSTTCECEDINTGEDLAFEYSLDGGTTWITSIDHIIGGANGTKGQDINISESIAVDCDQNIRFRWIQTLHSGDPFDAWQIRNILITTDSGDKDGDEVSDGCDVDDDNDGIVDRDELGCGSAMGSGMYTTTTGNNQVLEGTFTNGPATVNLEIDFTDVNAATANTANYISTSGEGVHYNFSDNDTDGLFTLDHTLSVSKGVGMDSIVWGAGVSGDNSTASTQDQNQQSITLTWSPALEAIVVDPDNQLNVADGSTLTSGTTIMTNADYNNGAATWYILFPETTDQNFTLTTSHDKTTAGRFNFEGFGKMLMYVSILIQIVMVFLIILTSILIMMVYLM